MENLPAPTFRLYDQTNTERALEDYSGRWVVLYFYASDDSLGCTAQACTFRDEYRVIQQFGNAEVLGINHASVSSHAAFTAKNHLNFPVLSDPDHAVTATYHSWKPLRSAILGQKYATQRNTFIIDPAGVIRKTYTGVKRSVKHTETVIQDLQKLQASAAKQSGAQRDQPDDNCLRVDDGIQDDKA